MPGLLTPLPLQFVRQYADAMDADMVFTTTADRMAYLTSPRRYGGMLVSDKQLQQVFILNTATDAWLPITGGNDDKLISITKAEADDYVAGIGGIGGDEYLVPGQFYQISGVHTSLYNDGATSGTEVILQALAENKLSAKGVGIFYTPKYDKTILEFGIWSNRSTFVASTIVGIFNGNELITANNGATGQLFTTIKSNTFIALTGDWAAATSITGNVTAATANIATIAIKTYAIDDTVIWGGYVWKNITGNVGSATDVLTLDATNWVKLAYDEDNYNINYDSIVYDYDNDIIISRSDVYGNMVTSNKADNDLWISKNGAGNYYGHPIAVSQWGNAYINSTGKGVGNNIVTNSYLECINLSGGLCFGNILNNRSSSQRNVLVRASFSSNYLNDTAEIRANTMYSSSLERNDPRPTNGYTNDANMPKINSNIIVSGRITDNRIECGGQMTSNTIDGGYMFSNYIKENYGSSSAVSTMSSNYSTDIISNNVVRSGSHIDSNKIITPTSVGSGIRGNMLTKSSNISSNILYSRSNISENTLFAFATINNNTITGVDDSNPASISNNINTTGQINDNVINGGRCDITYNTLGQIFSYADASGQCKINTCTLTGGGTIDSCNLQAGAELTDVTSTSYHITRMDLDGYKADFNNVALTQAIVRGDFNTQNIVIKLSQTFNNTAGRGTIGTVTLQALPILAGYFIEELVVDVGSGLTAGTGAIINFGIETDAADPALNDVTGLVTTLSTNKITKIAVSTFKKATTTRNLVMIVKTAAITAGTINVQVKLTKLT